MDALKEFPKTDIKLKTEKGIAVCQKTDIFSGFMWYAYEGEWSNWHKITAVQANKIIDANKNNKPVTSLEEFALDLAQNTKSDFENVVGQDSLTRFDSPKRHKKRKKNRGRNKTTNKSNKRKPQKSKNASK